MSDVWSEWSKVVEEVESLGLGHDTPLLANFGETFLCSTFTEKVWSKKMKRLSNREIDQDA